MTTCSAEPKVSSGWYCCASAAYGPTARMVPSRCTTAPSSITSASVRLRILQMTYLPRISDRAIGCSSHSGPCSCLLAGRGPQQGLEGPSNIGYMMERFLRNGFSHGLHLCLMPPQDDASDILTHAEGRVR